MEREAKRGLCEKGQRAVSWKRGNWEGKGAERELNNRTSAAPLMYSACAAQRPGWSRRLCGSWGCWGFWGLLDGEDMMNVVTRSLG